MFSVLFGLCCLLALSHGENQHERVLFQMIDEHTNLFETVDIQVTRLLFLFVACCFFASNFYYSQEIFFLESTKVCEQVQFGAATLPTAPIQPISAPRRASRGLSLAGSTNQDSVDGCKQRSAACAARTMVKPFLLISFSLFSSLSLSLSLFSSLFLLSLLSSLLFSLSLLGDCGWCIAS